MNGSVRFERRWFDIRIHRNIRAIGDFGGINALRGRCVLSASCLTATATMGKKHDRPISKTTVGRGKHFLPVKRGAGMTAAGRAAYNRLNNSHLQAPVTGKVKPGSAAAKRRKSFCARSKHWTGPRGVAARKRWKC